MESPFDNLGFVLPKFAYMYRDGGSYGFGFIANDGETYELHIKVVADSPFDCKRYFEPLIFRGSQNSNDVVAHPTWHETSKFLKNIDFENECFAELRQIVDSGGWRVLEHK